MYLSYSGIRHRNTNATEVGAGDFFEGVSMGETFEVGTGDFFEGVSMGSKRGNGLYS
jgi:hypothetical protein